MLQRGFTLIELLISLALLAILASLAAPNFSQFIAQRSVRATSEQLRDTMTYARQEALKRNRSIKVDISSNVVKTTVVSDSTNLQEWTAKVPVTDGTVTIDGNGRGTITNTFSVTSNQFTCKASGGPLACFNVQLLSGGAARLCDPQATTGSMEACL